MSLVQSQTRPASRGAPDSTTELTRGLVNASDAAFREFFASYARRLLLYNLALCNGDQEAAKELLQQTMVRVAKNIRAFETEAAFWSWLTVVARSCWIDEHRKRKRYRSLLDAFRQEQGTLAVAECAPNLDELLSDLEPDERDLLEDKYLAGLSVRELASARDTSEKAIESKLSRIREKLRRIASK